MTTLFPCLADSGINYDDDMHGGMTPQEEFEAETRAIELYKESHPSACILQIGESVSDEVSTLLEPLEWDIGE